MKKENELLENLAGFTGTTQWFKHPLFPKSRYTDGVKYLAVNAECYWLLEFIFSNQSNAKIRNAPFQVWKITTKDSKAVIRVEDGNDNLIKNFTISFTTFPFKNFSLWMVDGVLLLKTEY